MRYEKRQKKKKRRWSTFFLLFFLCLAGGFAYTYFQYQQGVSQSIDSIEENEDNIIVQEVYDFNGEKDQYGGTNILILGSDSRGEKASRADTIMIARYHSDQESYKIISIMRDAYVEIPGHGQNRINTAFALGGPELLRTTIKENFDIDIQYYAIVDFQGFVRLIDEAFPKGVEINVEKHMSHNIDVTIDPGLQYLDGEHLLGYVRFRHDAANDFGRVERQQEVVKQIGKQLTSFQTIPKLPKLMGVITPYINTNMKTSDILYIGKDFLSKDNRNIESLRIPADGAWHDADINGAKVLAIDLEKNKEIIHEFLVK